MAGRDDKPLVAILMGSDSDWETMEPAALPRPGPTEIPCSRA